MTEKEKHKRQQNCWVFYAVVWVCLIGDVPVPAGGWPSSLRLGEAMVPVYRALRDIWLVRRFYLSRRLKEVT